MTKNLIFQSLLLILISNPLFSSEFYDRLKKEESLSAFLMCGRPFLNTRKRMETDSFENFFDWIDRKIGVIKKKDIPNSIWWRTDNVRKLYDELKELGDVKLKVLWLAGEDEPWFSKLHPKVLEQFLDTDAVIYYEAKDIEHNEVLTAMQGYNTDYLGMFRRISIEEAILYSENQFYEKKGVLAAWGGVWPQLDQRIEDRRNARKFADSVEYVDMRMISKANWWKELSSYRFLISPLGGGIHTPKTWEALLVQTIPIVPNVPANRELKNLGYPLVLVDDWNEVTEENLEIWWAELSPKLADARWMLTTEWWFDHVFNN